MLEVPSRKICRVCCNGVSFSSPVVLKYDGFKLMKSSRKQILKDCFFSVNVSSLKEAASGTWRAGLNRDGCIFSCFWSFWLEECQD